ncbi:MAG: methyltransferase domain-containing protein [Sulfuricella sp.]|nr:methyltransferase domain-containing protein [Sulfuricella sp.]
MAHNDQLEFISDIKTLYPEFFVRKKILEVGSLDIQGSIRQFFENCNYTGIDVSPGEGVDIVCEGQSFDAPDESFDVVVSCEVMEHNPFWRETFSNMIRLCKPGGLILMTCATKGRPEHGTTRSDVGSSPLTVQKGWEYYKNLSQKDFELADLLADLNSYRFFYNWRHYDLYFIGFKSGGGCARTGQLSALGRKYFRKNFLTYRGLRRFLKVVLLGK